MGTSWQAAPARSDGCAWVQVRTEITCRHCGHRSPLDALDFDGASTCAACHLTQAFDTSAWTDVLAHAHAVADLNGCDLDGRNSSLAKSNPFAEIGISETHSRVDFTGMKTDRGVIRTRHVSIMAAPGHPLCESCGSPIEVEVHSLSARTHCPGCGERADYQMPPQVKAIAPGLVLAMGEPLRTDRPEAKLDATSAGMAIAVRCPNCGAALDLLDGKHFITCVYCKTHCRIPNRTLLAMRRGGDTAEPYWLLFRLPSAKRAQLDKRRQRSNTRKAEEDENPEALERAPLERNQGAELFAWMLQISLPLAILALVGMMSFAGVVFAWMQGYTSSEMRFPQSTYQGP
jgi:predicted RNA-binding Zn-ribbon protein involved in translation (DUF1610 family)